MRITVSYNPKGFLTFRQRVKVWSDEKWKTEAFRGVVDAGRKTKTRVQKAVYAQMAVRPGNYQSYVVANTFGRPNKGSLSFHITASQKGTDIRIYKGLKDLARGGRAARALNRGRSLGDRGFVRSGVWNNPRTFKRSFSQGGGFYSLIPGGSKKRYPRALWTRDDRSWQPRDGQGQFASTGGSGFRIRKLYGPALGKELAKDQSLQTFISFAPNELEKQVMKRLRKFL